MSPSFVSDVPHLVAWADALWPASEACAGRPARVRPIVTISVGDPGTHHAGISAVSTNDGLQSVILREPDNVSTLAHELAHAWSNGGAPSLGEGRVELLSECALRATGLGPPPGRTIDLAALEDVMTWTHGGSFDSMVNGYAAGRGIALVLSRVLTPTELWPEDGGLDWAELDRLLPWHGADGERVLQALHRGVDAQRVALADHDQDGLPSLAETLSGTRDDRWDTDGDGVWDGAPAQPPGFLPIRSDGRLHCLGLVGPATVAWVGANGPSARLRVGDGAFGPGERTVAGDGPVAIGVAPASAGGGWYRVEGGTPSPEGCLERPGFTLVVRPGSSVDLAVLAAGFARAVQGATKRGLPVPPFSVELTGDNGLVLDGRRARIDADAATGYGAPEVVVASLALDGLGSSSFGARLALAEDLGASPESLAGWGGSGDAAVWGAAAAGCATRWVGLVDGSCLLP